MTVRRLSFAAALLGAVIAAPAFADALAAPSADMRRPGQVARDHVDEFLRNLERFVVGLPRYGLPAVTENGDIVIPRLPSPRAPAESPYVREL